MAPCLLLFQPAHAYNVVEDDESLLIQDRIGVEQLKAAPTTNPELAALPAARSFWGAAMQTGVLIAGAEIFDKSFFIAMVLAMKHRHNWLSVILGGVMALSLHAVVCVAIGSAAAEVISRRMLSAIASGLFFSFAAVCAWEYAHAEIGAGSEELEEATRRLGGEADADKDQSISWRDSLTVFWTAFGLSLLGEFGDRTQLAMVSQAAIHDNKAVLVGSISAFALVETSAVMVGLCCGRSVEVSVRTVALLGGCCFTLFGVVALVDLLRPGAEAHALAVLLSLN